MDILDKQMEALVEKMHDHATESGIRLEWPVGSPETVRPVNRYQVPIWEFFTSTLIFKNDQYENVRTLDGDDALDIQEIVSSARAKLQDEGSVAEFRFSRLVSGYRSFNALKGMQYVVDLEYLGRSAYGEGAAIIRRVRLCRPIFSTDNVDSVPYTKEDSDITLVIPIESPEDVQAAKSLIIRHLNLCTSTAFSSDKRLTRVAVAARSVGAVSVREVSSSLADLKRKCQSWVTDTAVLLLKPMQE